MRRISSSAATGFLAAALVALPAMAAADIPPASGFVHEYTVNTTSAAPYVEDDGSCTLQEALDTIVKPSTFSGDCGEGAGSNENTPVRIRFAGAGRGTIKLTEELIVRPWSHVLIDGRGEHPHDEKVVLDGQGLTRVLRAAGPLCSGYDEASRTVLLRDLTITNGKAPATRLECGNRNLDRIGGGVVTDRGTSLFVDRVTFTDNEAIGGAAIAFHGFGSISDSTFAFNRTIVDSAGRVEGGAVYVYEGHVRLDGSTFFHNTVPDMSHLNVELARDLLGAWAVPDPIQVESYINVHVSAPGAPGRTCAKQGDFMTTVRTAGVDTSPPSLLAGTCDSNAEHNAVLMPVGQDLQPLAPGGNPRDALLDWGGWVPTIAFAPGSANHGRGGNFLTCDVLLRAPTNIWSPMRENPRGRDARGVDRPLQFCDAGSLEREFQTVDFPQPAAGTTVAGSTLFTPTASSGAPVTLTAGPEAVCSVTASGVRLHAAGECTATAEQAGNALYRPASVTRTFTVTELQPQTITFMPPAAEGVVGMALTLTATGGGSGNAVTLLVPPPTGKGAKATICTLTPLSSTGATTTVTVSFLNPGTCSIEALQGGSASYAPAAAWLDITVQAAPKKGGGPKK